MCGIAGLLSSVHDESLPDRLKAMLAALAHRGPDGEGRYLDMSRGLALGHKRLAIIDPEMGRQPMSNEDGSIQLVFNGCIYNFEDIKRLLTRARHRFQSHADTEVIVHAYEEWGQDCVHRFNGMWALALWDERRRILWCSRDRLGVKPFYYYWDGRCFIFGSEIKALLATGLIQREVDPDALRQYLTFQCALGSKTLFHGVNQLNPGASMVVGSESPPREKTFWQVNFAIDADHTEEYFIRKLAWLVEDSVKLRLRSDVPLGAHLSGGLDSATVVCLSRMLLGDFPLQTFTGTFAEGPAYDETPYARIVSRAARTEYFETCLSPQDFADSMARIMWHMDTPAGGPGVFPQYFVSKLAAQQVKVVLGGQGGDEVFIGYVRYLIAYLEECLKGAIWETADRERYVATLSTIIPNLPELKPYVPLLGFFWRDGLFGPGEERYFRLMDRFSDGQELFSSDLRQTLSQTISQTREEFAALFHPPDAAAMINRVFHFDLKTHLQALLQVEDRTSMAHGLESRVPLLDYRLVELMASVPPIIKFKGGKLKYLFRKAIQGLVPGEIETRRDKMGFPVPLNEWLRGPLRAWAHDLLMDSRARQRGLFNPERLEQALAQTSQFSRGLWGVLSLELWHRQFMD